MPVIAQNKTRFWLPIETAPKDETVIDLWCLDPRVTEARALGGLGRPIQRRRRGLRFVEYRWCLTRKCWRAAKDYHFVNDPEQYGGYIPMFWMPCPEDPEFIGTNRTLADA